MHQCVDIWLMHLDFNQFGSGNLLNRSQYGHNPYRISAARGWIRPKNCSKKGQKTEALSNEDEQEIRTGTILLGPWVTKTEGLDKEQTTTEGMKQEIKPMKKQGVHREVPISQLPPEQRRKIIKSRWVLRQTGNTARARIVAKGCTEEINDNDDIFASTPIFVPLERCSS